VFNSAMGFFRLIGMLEGLSFLVLLGIAMPLKYYADMPLAVTWVGMAHGVLFILYILAILAVLILKQLSVGKSLLAVLAAFIPFGPFILDYRLRKETVK